MAVGETLTILAAGVAAASSGNEMPDPAKVAAGLGLPENLPTLVEPTLEKGLPLYINNTEIQTLDEFDEFAQEGGGDDDDKQAVGTEEEGRTFVEGMSRRISEYDTNNPDVYGKVEISFGTDKTYTREFHIGMARAMFESYLKNVRHRLRNESFNGIVITLNPEEVPNDVLLANLSFGVDGSNGWRVVTLNMDGVMAHMEENQGGGIFDGLSNYIDFGLKDKLVGRFPVLENRTGQVRNGLKIALLSLSVIATGFIGVNRLASYAHKQILKKKGIRIPKP